jgi:hypothetical protein
MAKPKAKMTKAEEQTALAAMTTEERIVYHYQHGQGSIQDIARVYHYTVEQVLHIIGQDEMLSVPLGGDQVDAEDVTKSGLSYNYGTTDRAVYSTN